jgi:tRNA(Ile)-lysidine synthase
MSAAATARLDAAVERFFAGPGAPWATAPGVVAFSGGPDSTTLLAALARRARRRDLPLLAAHLDHGLDPGSGARAEGAAATARRLGIPCAAARRPVVRRPGESREAAARRLRYGYLAEVAARHGAAWVATGHHRDDQAETVGLRLLFGSGPAGLAGVRPVAELADGVALLRPLLSLSRRELAAGGGAPHAAVVDPTNRDLTVPRNRVRHRLLPALARREGLGEAELARRLAAVAGAAAGARAALDERLRPRLAVERHDAGGAALDLDALTALPPALLPFALALLHRAAGVPYPASAAARDELARQLAAQRSAGTGVGCDCGRHWRWRREGGRLVLCPAPQCGDGPPFSYTLTVPGELDLPELGLRLRLDRQPPAPWMYHGAPDRAGLDLPLVAGDRVVVRSRREGDRVHPLGAAGTRRLKDLLIDHRVPRSRRDRLPLVCVGTDGGTIAWVPGVTVDERYRLPASGGAQVWVAALVAGGEWPAGPGGCRGESGGEANRW